MLRCKIFKKTRKALFFNYMKSRKIFKNNDAPVNSY